MFFYKPLLLTAALAGLLVLVPGVRADAPVEPEIRFENHQWKPLNLKVPANQAMTIKVVNASNETIEFESFKLNREKVVSPGSSVNVNLSALSPGSYDFYDDFHDDVPQGTITAE